MKIVKAAFCSWFGTAMVCAAAFLPTMGHAAYPERPVTLVVPMAPGGSSDTASRILGNLLAEKWGQTVLIENKPGGSAAIGAAAVAKAQGDGYTLLVALLSTATIELFLKNPGFDRDRDLIPITQFAKGDYVLSIATKVPASTLPEFVDYARKNPDRVFHGAFGDGARMAFDGFVLANGLKIENVRYRGESLALNALIAGEVDVVLSSLTGARPFIEAGRIKPLAVPAKDRSPIVPDIPTANETGIKGFEADFWFGFMAPAGTPQAVREKIAADVAEVLARPEVQKRFQDLGLLAVSSSPDEFGQLIKYESERWVDVARHAGIEPQ